MELLAKFLFQQMAAEGGGGERITEISKTAVESSTRGLQCQEAPCLFVQIYNYKWVTHTHLNNLWQSSPWCTLSLT